MPYVAEISRSNPACILFLVDQSGSMADQWSGEGGQSKASGVATILNRLLQALVLKCTKGEEVRNYFYVSVVGYGGETRRLLTQEGDDPGPISWIADHPQRVEERQVDQEDGAGGLVKVTRRFPVWIDPVAESGTPMCAALGDILTLVRGWIERYPNSYPPVIFNITDGESTDGDPRPVARQVISQGTSDGSPLLFNVHVSSQSGAPILLADAPGALPDDYARMLFEMSSELPPAVRRLATAEGLVASPTSRGFVFNADPVSLIKFLDIGTRPANLR